MKNPEDALDVRLGECLLFLIEEGIDEAAHFRGPWHDISDDDLEFALNSPSVQATLIEYARSGIIELMKKALEERKEDARKHPGSLV